MDVREVLAFLVDSSESTGASDQIGGLLLAMKDDMEAELKDAIAGGACSMRDLRNDLDVGTQCGKCARDCKSLLNETLTAQASAGMATGQFIAA